MHPDEFDITTDLVRRLIAEQFPRWSTLPIEPVPFFGTDNAIYRLGKDMAVRLPRRQVDVERLEKECRWLPELAPLLPLPVPVPLAAGRPTAYYPFIWAIYRWLEGKTATVEPPCDSVLAAADLAAFIAALQRIDPGGGPPPGAHNAFRGVPLSTRDEATRACIAALRGSIDTDAATVIWEEALRASSWDRSPVWIHGDLDARNLLVREGRVCAVIDFGCLGVGDPACDIQVAWKMFTAEARDIFRTTLSVDGATWARGRGWALSQAVGIFTYYTMETNPALVLEGQRWLAEILSDSASMR